MPTLSSGSRVGRFVVRSALGAGGMGEVYAAQDPTLNRLVALKLVRSDHASPEAQARFRQEALAASALNHPNILTIYELGEIDDAQFIAAELVEGQTLRQLLRQRAGRLEWPAVFEIASQIGGALSAAHRAGIVHRDIKPDNVMVRPDGLVKVLDFGLAKRATLADTDHSTLLVTAPGMVLGTVLYMAPEQVRGLPVDARTDIWAFGCVLYEMASGQSPFSGATSADVVASVLEREPAPLTTLRADCPPALASTVIDMLEKDPARRTQSMLDVEQSLRLARDSASTTLDALTTAATVHIDEAAVTPARSTARRMVLLGLVGVAVAGLGAAVAFRDRDTGLGTLPPTEVTTAPAASRQLDVWLTVQKMRDGSQYEDPFVSTGQEIFETGWKFRLHTMSRDGGYLYVLNEGKSETGETTLHLLFPTPRINDGSPQLTPLVAVESGWYVFTGQKGTEKFWLVSSPDPVPALDAVKAVVNPVDKGLIADTGPLAAIRALLEGAAVSPATVGKDRERRHTTLTSATPLLVHAIELEHH